MNFLSDVRIVFWQAFRLPSTRLSVANYSKATDPKADEVIYDEGETKPNVADLLVDEVDLEAREKEITRMRNKSRLNKTHRNLLFNLSKPDEEFPWDKTLYFSRKQYARYGSKTNINPRLCFYTPDELEDKREYERVAYPLTIQEMVEIYKKEKAEKLEKIRLREEKIAYNLTRLEKWKEDLNARIIRKEEDARTAKAKREQMLEDIRQEIGFKIDFKDPRFQALMEKKELEAKKAKKAEKKKQREAQLMAKLKEQAQATLASSQKETKAGDSKAPDGTTQAPDGTTQAPDGSGSSSESDSDDEKDQKK